MVSDEQVRGRWTVQLRIHTHFGPWPVTILGSEHRERSLSRARRYCNRMNANRGRADYLYFVRRSDRRSGV